MDVKKYHHPYSNKSESDIGILLIHGITSTTSTMIYMAKEFSKRNFNVELPGLSGHGTKWQDLNKICYEDWIADLEQALNKLKQRCSKIFLCGLSLGGGLALFMASRHPELTGLILINHATKFSHPKFWFVPILRKLVKSTPAVASDIKDSNSREIAYDRTPTNAVYEMLKMLKQVRTKLPEIRQPVIIFKSREDHVVPRISATYTIKNIGSEFKELIWLENSYHVAPLDNDKKLIVQKSCEFVIAQSKK
ncbi:MAG: alpha/beta fold hydrolase [Candidatus Cloacimonetes bacterium]|nr:alpha/beta fold hydrolase [Candidatus Cloacimonadota bacterium]